MTYTAVICDTTYSPRHMRVNIDENGYYKVYP